MCVIVKFLKAKQNTSNNKKQSKPTTAVKNKTRKHTLETPREKWYVSYGRFLIERMKSRRQPQVPVLTDGDYQFLEL